MKKKVVWLVASCLMVAALLLASCAPAVTEDKKVAPPVKEEKVAPPVKEEVVVSEKEVGMVKDSLGRLVEKPRYGGMMTEALATPILGFDPNIVTPSASIASNLALENLVVANWVMGPAGTNEASFMGSIWNPIRFYIGPEASALAESWEVPDPDTVIYHIRKGVHFALDPKSEASRLVNGRELTAYDVAFSFDYRWKPGSRSYEALTYPRATNILSMEATDKWTFVFKTLPGSRATLYETPHSIVSTFPPEVMQKYGDINDWRNVVGTGPFMIADSVPAVSTTLVRNPNYWRKHPLYPEDTMPYLDSVKFLIIPDASTRMAALRTGKMDFIKDISWDDASSLMKTNPELKWKEFPGGSQLFIAMRLDRPELPFKDVRVRQALSMGINRQPIKDLFFGGKATMYAWPYGPVPEMAKMYTPLEEQPESIRGLQSYNPEKAKQLLAEAGYPKGFKTEIAITAPDADLLSIVKEDWAKIGVDAKLDVKEYTVWNALKVRKSYSEMIYSPDSWTKSARRFPAIRKGTTANISVIDDPVINEYDIKVSAAFPDEAKMDALMKELLPYLHTQLFFIPLPTPILYRFWQPWVRDFHGEQSVGYTLPGAQYPYLWYDQDLKEKMTGRR